MLRITNKSGDFLRDDFTFDPETEVGLDVEPAQGLYEPKWDGEKWVDGATQEYINGIIAQQPAEPTAEGKITALEAKEGKALKYIKVGSVIFGDLTSGTAKALALANVPAGSMITQVICQVTDAFNSGSGDTIAVGISGTANKFLATTDITATTVGAYTKAVAYQNDSALTVYATWTGTGTAADAGGFEVYVAYFDL